MLGTCSRAFSPLATPFLASLFFCFGCASLPTWAPPERPSFALFTEAADLTCAQEEAPLFQDDHGVICVDPTPLLGPTAYTDDKGRLKAIGRADDHSPWVFFHDNGAPRAQGWTKEGAREGAWSFYNPEAALRAKGDYGHGMPAWEWTFFHPNGEIAIEGDYTQAYSDCEGNVHAPGLRKSGWTWYHPNGNPSMDVEYEKGAPHGAFAAYHENGNPSLEGQFLAGEPSGSWKRYDPQGGFLEEIHFEYRGPVVGEIKEGQREGPWISYDAKGVLREEGSYAKGRREGHWIFRSANGAILREGAYRSFDEEAESLPDGEWREYDLSGALRRAGSWSEGAKNGTWTLYAPNGEALATYELEDGYGEVPFFDEAGTQIEICEMTHDLRDGLCVGDSPDGLRYEHKYREGVPHGRWSTFNEAGDLVRECTYSRGEDLGCHEGPNLEEGFATEKTYYPNGQLKRTGQYYLEEREKKEAESWVEYHPDGAIAATGSYVFGSRDNSWVTTSPQGQITSKGEFYRGERVGTWIFNDDQGVLIASGELEHDLPVGPWHLRGEEGTEEIFFEGGWTGTYLDGVRHGNWRRFAVKETHLETGTRFSLVPVEEVEWVDGYRHGAYSLEEGGWTLSGTHKQDFKEGTWIKRWTDSEVMPPEAPQSEQRARDCDDRITEMAREDLENAAYRSEVTYRKGIEQEAYYWDREGRLLSSREGEITRHYFPSGQLHAEDRREVDGTATYYWPNGQLRARGNLEQWPSSEWELWSMDGTPIPLPTSPEGVDYPWERERSNDRRE